MKIHRIDHLVLIVADIDRTMEFYTEILGFTLNEFGDGRKALIFGNQRINLHQKDKEIDPKAKFSTWGSADLCFIANTEIEEN